MPIYTVDWWEGADVRSLSRVEELLVSSKPLEDSYRCAPDPEHSRFREALHLEITALPSAHRQIKNAINQMRKQPYASYTLSRGVLRLTSRKLPVRQ